MLDFKAVKIVIVIGMVKLLVVVIGRVRQRFVKMAKRPMAIRMFKPRLVVKRVITQAIRGDVIMARDYKVT